jgi:hypothetical protein
MNTGYRTGYRYLVVSVGAGVVEGDQAALVLGVNVRPAVEQVLHHAHTVVACTRGYVVMLASSFIYCIVASYYATSIRVDLAY